MAGGLLVTHYLRRLIMQNDKTSEGLSPVTLEAMQQHRRGEETSFHPSLTQGYQRAEVDHRAEDISRVLGGLLLMALVMAYAFSGNL